MSPWSTYTGTKLETADTAKEHLQRTVFSSTRKWTVRRLTGPLALLPFRHMPSPLAVNLWKALLRGR